MKKLLKNNKLRIGLLITSFLAMTFSTFYILYAVSLLNGIENIIRLLLAIILFLIWICLIVGYKNTLKKKSVKTIILIFFTIIYSIILFGIGFYINKAYSSLKGMTSSTTNYSTSLVTLSENKAKDIKNIKEGSVGILADSTNIVGNVLPLEIINKNKIKNDVLEYDSFPELINALLDNEVEYAFLPSKYVDMFSDSEQYHFTNLDEKTKIIYSKTKTEKNAKNNNKKITEPFTILLMGVDSELDDISSGSYMGDSLMLITFNPKTLNTTILSIPRDSYVPIACYSGQARSKITHAAPYGLNCMKETIQNYTGITIDYYAVINFKGIVNLVDTLGGIEVDIPYAFCEQNSSRKWGNSTIYVEEGLQILNGEKALAFSRNRHPWPEFCSKKYSNYFSNDFIRGQHQQIVLTAILNKMKTTKNLNTLTSLLDTISKNMETNMTINEILSFYNIGKSILAKAKDAETDVTELISMQKLYLNGKDAYVYEGKSQIYVFDIYTASKDAVIEAMRVNLGLAESKVIKEFSFDIDTPYEENIIGKNITGNTSLKRLPDFTGDTEAQARSTCSKLGINVSFKYVSTGEGINNTVVAQNYHANTDLKNIKSIVLTILKKETNTEQKNDDKDKTEVNDKDDKKNTTDNTKDDEEPDINKDINNIDND